MNSLRGPRNRGTMLKAALKRKRPTWPTSLETPKCAVISAMPLEYAAVAVIHMPREREEASRVSIDWQSINSHRKVALTRKKKGGMTHQDQ